MFYLVKSKLKEGQHNPGDMIILLNQITGFMCKKASDDLYALKIDLSDGSVVSHYNSESDLKNELLNLMNLLGANNESNKNMVANLELKSPSEKSKKINDLLESILD